MFYNGLLSLSLKKLLLVLIISTTALPTFSEVMSSENAVMVNKRNGNVAEKLMDDYFKKGGWTKLNGEIGSNGIDGLYVKKKNGVISEVLIAESKYNTSSLGTTKQGARQMSKQWTEVKIDALIKDARKRGNTQALKQYLQVMAHVKRGNYRARLWKMIPKMNGQYLFELKKIVASGENLISIEPLTGNHKYKIDQTIIDTLNPKTAYDKAMAKSIRKHQSQETQTLSNRSSTMRTKHLKLRSKVARKALTLSKSVVKATSIGFFKGILKSLPFIGAVALIADDIRMENKLSGLEESNKVNADNINVNANNINVNADNIAGNRNLIADLEQRMIEEQSLINIKIEDNANNILDIYSKLGNIDASIIHLSKNITEVVNDVSKNTQAIAQINNGIVQTGINQLSLYYKTNNQLHLNNAYHDFEKSIHIHQDKATPIMYMYYLVALAELHSANPQEAYVQDIKTYYQKMVALTTQDPTLRPILNASYASIQAFEAEQSYFTQPLLTLYEGWLQQHYAKHDYDAAYVLAQEVNSAVQSRVSAALLKTAQQQRKQNYQANKSFGSKYDVLDKVALYHNEPLLKEAIRYLYQNNYNADVSQLLQTHTFQDTEFKLKAYLSLYARKDIDKFQKLKSLIKSNSTYSSTLKSYAHSI